MNAVPVRVRDCMTRDPATVTADTDITSVVRIMVDRDLSGLLVVASGDRLLGIVTERDCIAAAPAAQYYGDWGGPVSKFMSAPVETVSPEDNIVDVAVRMSASRYRRFPVVEGDRLVGLLSRRDLLRALDAGAWSKPPASESSHK